METDLETLAAEDDLGVMLLDPETEDAAERRWEATLAIEGVPTVDGRFFPVDSLGWRDLPLTLLAQVVTAEGHDEAFIVGRIDEVWKVPGDNEEVFVMGRGVFDSSDQAQEVARLVEEKTLRGLSIDVATGDTFLRDPVTGLAVDLDDADPFDVLMSGKYQTAFGEGKIGAATIVSFQAFDDATISIVASADYMIRIPQAVWPKRQGLTASAAGIAPLAPPADWFADPGFEGPTPLTVTDDGQVFGHLALWDTCHIGMPNGCQTAPRSRSDYGFFHLGEIATEDGSRIPVGKITLDTGHAPLSAGKGATLRHYDDTGTGAADVRAGEDRFGIWVAGAARPDVPASTIRRLRAATISGDWRRIEGSLELVAALAVNVPGFPVPRPAANVVASGERAQTLALVAAGAMCECGSPVMSVEEARIRIDALASLILV